MTQQDRIIFAVLSLRSARAEKRDARAKESREEWQKECITRKQYVQELEQMYKMKFYKLVY